MCERPADLTELSVTDAARLIALKHFVDTFETYAVEALIGPTTPSGIG